MPQLGLGLGLNKGSYIKSLPKYLTDAGCTFAINVDRQVKALTNPNSPFINPLVDITKKGNNVTLQSFAGTTADGYTQIALPNGKNPWFLKFEGSDSLGIIANTADVDILGTNDFAISCVFSTPNPASTGFIVAKSLAQANGDYQYMLSISGSQLYARLQGVIKTLNQTVLANELYNVLLYRKSGRLYAKVLNVEKYNQPSTESLTSQPNMRIGASSGNAGGTTHTGFANINLGNLAIFYNGATGLDIAKVEKAVAKFNANYI